MRNRIHNQYAILHCHNCRPTLQLWQYRAHSKINIVYIYQCQRCNYLITCNYSHQHVKISEHVDGNIIYILNNNRKYHMTNGRLYRIEV